MARRYKNKPVLVIRVLLHVQSPQPLGLIDERPLFAFGKRLPFGPEAFGDLRVVHFWVLLSHFTSLTSRPDHKSVHRPLDTIRIVLVIGAVGRTGLMHSFDIIVVRRRPWAGHFTPGAGG